MVEQTAKTSLSTFILLIVVGFFLWYRNAETDRLLAVLIFTASLFVLLEYGVRSTANPDQSGRILFILLWLQVAMLAIGSWMRLNTQLSAAVAIAFTIIFGVALLYAMSTTEPFGADLTPNGWIEWTRDGHTLLGNTTLLYFLGLFLPLLLLAVEDSSTGLTFLFAYLVVSTMLIYTYSTQSTFLSIWFSSWIIFAFLAWLIHAF